MVRKMVTLSSVALVSYVSDTILLVNVVLESVSIGFLGQKRFTPGIQGNMHDTRRSIPQKYRC